MPLAEKVGPQGYWRNPADPIDKTIDEDRRSIAMLQDHVPNRFTAKADDREIDLTIYEQCVAIGKEDAAEEGWDFTWLERLAGIELDTLYKQLIGSCVATSHITLLATRMLHEILLFGQGEELLGKQIQGRESICPFGPYSYRAGRKYAGINGRSDGSTCSGQIRGTMALGFLACDHPELDSDDFPEPKSTSLYRQWGSNDTLMNQFVDDAGKFDLLTSIECRDAETASTRMLDHFEPLQICSGWAFVPTDKRLPNGDILYRRRGSWMHSMQVQAKVKMTDNNWYRKIRNQWGNTHNGKNYFWIEEEEFARWIRDSNTMSIGEIQMRSGPDASLFPISI